MLMLAGVLGLTVCYTAQDLIELALVGASDGLINDLSVHICFICLLHLANEHSLHITGAPSLDSIAIHSA